MRKAMRVEVQGKGNEDRSDRRQRGQSLVEMAVLVPILLLLLAAAIDAGRAFDAYIVLTNAAREGARFASLQYPLDEPTILELVVDDVVGSGTNVTSMAEFTTTNVTLLGADDSPAVTVTVAYTLDLWFGGLVGIDQFPLQKTAIMPRAE